MRRKTDLLKTLILSPAQFGGTLTHDDFIEFKNFLLQLKHQGSESKTAWFFYYFNFEKNYDVLKSKSSCILLNNRKWKIPHTVLDRRTLDLDELELAKEQRRHFCTIYFARRYFFKYLYFTSMYSVLNTFSEYTCLSINITSYTFLLVFKVVESLQCTLKVRTYLEAVLLTETM